MEISEHRLCLPCLWMGPFRLRGTSRTVNNGWGLLHTDCIILSERLQTGPNDDHFGRLNP